MHNSIMLDPKLMKITTSTDYYDEAGIEVDWNETDNKNLLPIKEANAMQNILTCETSIYLLRRTAGANFCGSLVDDMVSIRRKFINSYEKEYEKKYTEHNDFY